MIEPRREQRNRRPPLVNYFVVHPVVRNVSFITLVAVGAIGFVLAPRWDVRGQAIAVVLASLALLIAMYMAYALWSAFQSALELEIRRPRPLSYEQLRRWTRLQILARRVLYPVLALMPILVAYALAKFLPPVVGDLGQPLPNLFAPRPLDEVWAFLFIPPLLMSLSLHAARQWPKTARTLTGTAAWLVAFALYFSVALGVVAFYQREAINHYLQGHILDAFALSVFFGCGLSRLPGVSRDVRVRRHQTKQRHFVVLQRSWRRTELGPLFLFNAYLVGATVVVITTAEYTAGAHPIDLREGPLLGAVYGLWLAWSTRSLFKVWAWLGNLNVLWRQGRRPRGLARALDVAVGAAVCQVREMLLPLPLAIDVWIIVTAMDETVLPYAPRRLRKLGIDVAGVATSGKSYMVQFRNWRVGVVDLPALKLLCEQFQGDEACLLAMHRGPVTHEDHKLAARSPGLLLLNAEALNAQARRMVADVVDGNGGTVCQAE